MQKLTGEKTTNESPRETAMNWIGNLVEKIASCLGKQIAGWHWEVDGTKGNTTTYQLVVVGSRDRRAIKLFTSDELDRCMRDKELQFEINERLTRMVTFLDGRGDSQRTQRAARKLR